MALCLVLGHAGLLRAAALHDWPATIALAQGLLGIGFLALPWLIGRAEPSRVLLSAIFLAGLVARLTQLDAPALREDDFYRYFLDGMATLQGINPFTITPADVLARDGAPLGMAGLDTAARAVVEQVNHPTIRTIYAGTAQAAFAIAALIEPWSLAAWRGVLLAIDGMTLLVLLALLRQLGRSPAWVALYWLNPLAIKEAFNAAHFEPLLALCVLTSILWALRGRARMAAAMLGLAAGVKVWPVLLLPLVARHAANGLEQSISAIGVFAGVTLMVFLPALLAPFDAASGFGAYGAYWINNAPVFDTIRAAANALGQALGPTFTDASLALRGLAALAVGGTALALALRPAAGPEAFVRRCFLIVVVLFLASPVKLPWYGLWPCMFLPLLTGTRLLVLVPCLGLYPLYHVVDPGGTDAPRSSWLAWLMVFPIWCAAAWCLWRNRRDRNGIAARGCHHPGAQ